MIALRTPRQKTALYGTVPLTAQEAFSGIPKARIGGHNDCFLASDTDFGTWSKDIVAEKAFYHQENLFVPPRRRNLQFQGSGTAIRGLRKCAEGARVPALQFAQQPLSPEVLDGWTKGGCMPEIRRRLGYRFRLVDSSTQVAGRELRITLTVRNEGFGNLYNPRPVVLVLRERATGRIERVPIPTDPRRWMPAESTTVRASATLPPGEYDVFLHLPDAAPSLRDRPEFAVRFANAGVWESDTGMNRLTERAVIGK